MTSRQLVVGFDLDMTLIDTRPGFGAVLLALGEELGVELPVEKLVGRLGPPLDRLLAPYVPQSHIQAAVARFRVLYPELSVSTVPALPGAIESLAAVRASGGRSIVVTGKFTANAQLHLDHLGLLPDHLIGEVWGAGKAAPLLAHGAQVYVGDHIHDVEGARAAGVLSVSVLTGGCTEQELREAGTDVVLADLTEFPAWLADHAPQQEWSVACGEH